MHKELKALFTALPGNGIGRNNAISVFLMGALPAVGGSIISAMLYVFFIWGAISLVLRRFEFRMTRSDRMLAWTFTSFVGFEVVTALFGENLPNAPTALVWLFAFLAPWVLISRLRASSELDYLGLFVLGAAVGAIAAGLVAFVQLIVTDIRPKAGAGNAAVFAIMSLCLMGLGGLNITASARWRRLLAMAAVVFGGLAVVLSQTRGVLAVCVPLLGLLWLFSPSAWRRALARFTTLVILAAAGIAAYFAHHALDGRWEYTLSELRHIFNGGTSTSIGERLRLWNAAVKAIQESPILGYGIQNRMDALVPTLKLDGLPILQYTHAHNGFLSFALDGGVFVLVAVIAVLCVPVVLARRASQDAHYRLRLFMALTVTGTYALCGLTQIMFKHDIMDSFFVFFSILVAASIPEQESTPAVVTSSSS